MQGSISRFLYFLLLIWASDGAQPSVAPTHVRSTMNIIQTVIGTGDPTTTGTGGPAISASISEPRRAYVDSTGDMYVLEKLSSCVRKFSTTDGLGIVKSFAGVCGSAADFAGDGGPATSALLNAGAFLTADTVGTVYIADFNRVRKVSASSGIISTILGDGSAVDSGDQGPSTSATINLADGMWVNSLGVLYVVSVRSAIRAISTAGIISRYAGSYIQGFSGDGGAATSAWFYYPEGLIGDSAGQLYLADSSNKRFRLISSAGIVTTLAGDGGGSYKGENVAATSTGFSYPLGVEVDSSNGDMYMSDWGLHRVFVRTATTTLISTFAGNGDDFSYGDGGAAASAGLPNAASLSLTTTGILYVSELQGYRVRAVFSNSPTLAPTAAPSHIRSNNLIIKNYAGSGSSDSSGSGGPAVAAGFSALRFISQDSVGNFYVAEQGARCVRQITIDGIVNDFVGVCNGDQEYSGDNGKATSATFMNLVSVFVSSTSDVYVTDFGPAHARKVSAVSGIITNFAGTGDNDVYGNGGAATSAALNPHGIWGDSAGNVYLADLTHYNVRKVSSAGIISLFAGGGDSGFCGDGGPAVSACLSLAYNVNGDTTGVVYIADYDGGRLRMVDTSGIISTFIGGGDGVLTDGSNPQQITFYSPSGIAVDGNNGDVYVSSRNDAKVYVVTGSTGLISTFAGGGVASPLDQTYGDGGKPTDAAFLVPDGIFLDSSSNLYIVDSTVNRVRWITIPDPSLAPTYVPTFIAPTVAPSISFAPSHIRDTSYHISTFAGNGQQTFSEDDLGGQATDAAMTARTVWPDTLGNIYMAEQKTFCVRRITTDGIVENFAGVCGTVGNSGNGGAATSAQFTNVVDAFVNTLGVVYIADFEMYTLRSVSVSGISLAGGDGSMDTYGDGGPATSAAFLVIGVWGDTSGNLFFASYNQHRFRKIDVNGIITLFAGTGSLDFSGDGGAASSATFNNPFRTTGDTTGTLYLSDSYNCRVRTVTPDGIIQTIAGNGESGDYIAEDVQATSAVLDVTAGVAVDANNGDLYTSRYSGGRVYVVTRSTGLISTFAGFGVPDLNYATPPNGDGGAASAAVINTPDGLYLDSTNQLYVSDIGDWKVRLISSRAPTLAPTTIAPTVAPSISFAPSHIRDTSYHISTFAGNGVDLVNQDDVGGPAINAAIAARSIWPDTMGNFYVAEQVNHCVRKITTDGIVENFAGICGTVGNSGDGGAATSALFDNLCGSFVDSLSVVYIADYGASNNLRAVTVDGIVSLVGGNGALDSYGDGGPATSAALAAIDLWGDTSGNLIVATLDMNRFRKIDVNGIVTLFAGTGVADFSGDGGPATSATLQFPFRVTGDSTGLVYLSDCNNHRVRTVTPGGIIQTIAGNGGNGDYITEDVQATAALLDATSGLAVDANNGDYYISRYAGARVYVVTRSTGLITTFAGFGVPDLNYATPPNGDDGAASSAVLGTPDGLYLDSTNQLYVADMTDHKIRLISSRAPTLAPTTVPTHIRSSNQIIQNYAGSGSSTSSGSGGPAAAAGFANLRFISQDSVGNLYVSEQAANCVRQITTDGIVNAFVGVCDTAQQASGDNGKATSATFTNLVSVFVSSTSDIYVTDFGPAHARKVSAVSGIITNFAGTGVNAASGNGGAATSAAVNPHGIWGDSAGNVYLADLTHYNVRKVSSAGIISLFAGSGDSGFCGDGGPAISACINGAYNVNGDTTGVVYISDYDGGRLRKVDTSGIISTFIGGGSAALTDGSNPQQISFASPAGIAVDGDNGDVYCSSRNNVKVYVVTGSTGLISTFAGGGVASPLDPTYGDGGKPTDAAFLVPDGIFLDSSGKLYVADISVNRVRVIADADPTITPSFAPSTMVPTTAAPSVIPTIVPTAVPSLSPSYSPTFSALPIRSSPNYKVTNAYAFAGLTSEGGVMSWGSSTSGGDSSSLSSSLTSGVLSVVSSKNAFAALKIDGTVVAWGRSAEISGWTAYTTAAANVVSLVGSEQAFAGVTSSGGVIAFGADCCGGNVDQYGWAQYLTSDVKSITASAGAFCALKTDGSVYCWGNAYTGGGVSSVSRTDISGVLMLVASRSAFAAMTSGDKVVTWGDAEYGGAIPTSTSNFLREIAHILSNEGGFAAYASERLFSWGSSGVISGMTDVTYVAHSCCAFAALKSDLTVTAWGDDDMGGDASSVSSQLVEITSLIGSGGAFAALTSSSNVVVWGGAKEGGQLFGNVSSSLSEIQSVSNTKRAFAALSASGAVTVWGATNFGGAMSATVSSNLQSEVRLICANDVAFTAIKNDGSAYGWGFSQANVGTGLLSGDYTSILSC